MKSGTTLLACVALVAFAVVSPSAAGAAHIESATGKGCLDFDYGDRFESEDYDAHGANVVVFECHRRQNQDWSIDGKIISVTVDGERYCLDLNRGAPFESHRMTGYNVIGWSDCHGASIQQWTREGEGFSVTWNDQDFCLTLWERPLKEHPEGGTVYNVVAWPVACDNNPARKWSIVD